jgi:hypothetical protein
MENDIIFQLPAKSRHLFGQGIICLLMIKKPPVDSLVIGFD